MICRMVVGKMIMLLRLIQILDEFQSMGLVACLVEILP
jgi:hypothetical protein